MLLALLVMACSFDTAGQARRLDAADLTRFDVAVPRIDAKQTIDDGCGGSVDSATLALYTMESASAAVDLIGNHHGTLVGNPSFVAGPPNCGEALQFADSADSFIQVADSPAWDLATGSIDLGVRPISPNASYAIISRDANGASQSGHITLYQHTDGFYLLRLQQTGAADVYLCSAQNVVPGEWTHIGINLGAAATEMWVDGVLADRNATFVLYGVDSCPGATAMGIAGNNNPWVFGGAIVRSLEGGATPVTDHFVGGAIDQLRISSTRRDFSSP